MSKINYKETGEGDALLFIHGFCEGHEVWESCHSHLSDTYRVISVDLPGYGVSETQHPLTIESMTEAVFDLISSMHLSRCMVIGHSMGGYVALALADKYPSLIAGLAMLNSTSYADSDEKRLQRDKTIRYLHEYGVESFIRPFVPPLFYPQNRQKCEREIDLLIKLGCSLSVDVIAACAAAMRDRPDRTYVLKQAVFPVLYIIGKNDSAVKMDDSLAQCHLAPQSHALFLADTGHQAIFEQQMEVLKALSYFGKIVFN